MCCLSVGQVAAAAVVVVAVAGSKLAAGSSVEQSETVRGMGRGQLRMFLGHRPCRLAHRTPVLYSRNQSRTNIALFKEMERRGRVSLPSCSI